MTPRDYSIRVAKFFFRLISGKKFENPACSLSRQDANEAIYNLLILDKPCMISRFGTTELNCINNYLCISSNLPYYKKILNYITDNTHTPWWNRDHFYYLSVYSGIFPPNEYTAENFSKRYIDDMPLIDILGSFQYYEKFMPLKESVSRFQLETLYPFFVDKPWTLALKNKKVLVVHPFNNSIEHQYKKRSKIFINQDILPNYKLITYRSIQSIGGAKVPFKDWFVALAHMENEISKIDFDICILGCGAYGLPLAAHVKRLGKKAVHLGGGTQLLFGIKGKRWTEQYEVQQEYRLGEFINTNYMDLFNEEWIFPLPEEKPINSDKVENSCYW